VSFVVVVAYHAIIPTILPFLKLRTSDSTLFFEASHNNAFAAISNYISMMVASR